MLFQTSRSSAVGPTCNRIESASNERRSEMSFVIFLIKHSHSSGRNVMLRSVSDRIEGGARAYVCGRSGGVCQACAFFSATHYVVQTWAETVRVDVPAQLLVSLTIVLHYKCRPLVII